jgi:DNA polymerase-4
LTVKVRYSDFTTVTRARTLSVPTADPAMISRCASQLLHQTEASQRPVRLLGVGASNLVPGSLEQLKLFE